MKKWDFHLKKLKEMKTGTWILLLLAGVLLLAISFPAKRNKETTGMTGTENTAEGEGASSGRADMDAYGKQIEKRVAEILSSMEGVGNAEVMVTLESKGETILQTDASSESGTTRETDSEGGTRLTEEKSLNSQTVLVGGEESPYVTKELYPKVTGIVIVTEGGGEASIKAEISEAMEALFDLPAHKIKVLKRVKEES